MAFKTIDVPEWNRIFDALKKAKTDYIMGLYPLRNLVLMEILMYYGKRIGEVAQITKEDIEPEKAVSTRENNFVKGWVRFHVEKKGKWAYSDKPIVPIIKDDLIRYWETIPAGARLFNVSTRQLRNLIHLFFWQYLFERKMKCSICGLEGLTRICACGGLCKKITRRPHVFRHASVTFWRKSMGLEPARLWHDHTDIRTTQSYGTYDTETLLDKMKENKMFFF